MIRSVQIHDPSKMVPKHFASVPSLAKPRTFEFKPGINVLYGENGSGKTTLLNAIAKMFHAEQGDVPAVTEHSLRELADYRGKTLADMQKILTIDHDGQPVRHHDPSEAVGTVGGLAAFDWDFGMEGLRNVMFKGSAGQTTLCRSERLVNDLARGVVPAIEWKSPKDWTIEKHPWIVPFLAGSGDKGQPTVFLDESERSYDLEKQYQHWRFLRSVASEVQIIVASHSIFAVDIEEANYIDLVPGRLDRARRIYASAVIDWPTQRFRPIAEIRTKSANFTAPIAPDKPTKKPRSKSDDT